jgi:hypothetical protein
MDSGKVFVCDNSIDRVQMDGSCFLGRFFLSAVWEAAMKRMSRPAHQRKPVFVFVDEADIVIKADPIIALIIDKCRSANIGLLICIQRKQSIKDPDVLSALESCAIRMANVDAEAAYFSNLLHIPEERINSLKTGQFAIHVRGSGSSIMKITPSPLPRTMTPAEEVALKARMKRDYGVEPENPTEKQKAAAPEPPRPATKATGEKPTIPAPAVSTSTHVQDTAPTQTPSDPSAPARWGPSKK